MVGLSRLIAYGRYKHIFSTEKVEIAMKRIHVVDSKAIEVAAHEEVVVAIGPAAAAFRAKGVPIIEADSPHAAARYVRGAFPAVLRLSVADPLEFFALLLERDEAPARLVA
jgi:hypothetical protein